MNRWLAQQAARAHEALTARAPGSASLVLRDLKETLRDIDGDDAVLQAAALMENAERLAFARRIDEAREAFEAACRLLPPMEA